MIKHAIRCGLMVLVFAGIGCNKDKPAEPKSVQVVSLEDVKKYAPGTWTNETIKGDTATWVKLVLNADGTGEKYFALIADDNWGAPTNIKWKPYTDKYSDTGIRWYGMTFVSKEDDGFEQQWIFPGAFENSNVFYIDGKMYSRGDKFPFSK